VRIRTLWEQLARSIVRRPVVVLATAAAVIVGLSVGLTRLEFRTDQAALIDQDSAAYKDNLRYQDRFGGEGMLVLFTGDPVDLFSAENLPKLEALEDELRDTPGVETVVGPHTTMSFAIDQLSVAPELIGKAFSRAPDPDAYGAALGADLGRLSAAGEASIDNPDYVRFLLFDADGEVRAGQRTTFPDGNHALLAAQLTGNASIDEQAAAAKAIEAVVSSYDFGGHETLVTGSPALLDEINRSLKGGMGSLGGIALVVMLAVLWLAFRVRWRLLPLAVMACGTAAALGGAVLLGIDLSIVTISGLPIFIGLGVDFAIQLHNRYAEQRAEGDSAEQAATVAVTTMAGPLTVAMVAGAFGFAALRLSPVPMIQDFGLLLCLGVVILVAAAIVLPATVLVLADRNRPAMPPAATTTPGLIERGVARMAGLSTRVVVGILAVGVVMAGAGFLVEGKTPIDTDVEHWVPSDTAALGDLDQVRSVTGFSSQMSIMVEADDVTSDAVVEWMYRFQTAELERHGDQLLSSGSAPSVAAGIVRLAPTGEDVRTLMDVAPADIRTTLLSEDGKAANVLFALGDMSLSERGDLTDAIQRDLRGDLAPPVGVTATPAGLAVIGTELVRGMESNRQTLTLAALAFVALFLLVRGRLRARSLLPVVPVALAVGIASLVIWVLGYELTPLTTVAGPLVIAVATEFTVLLEARYREERARGRTPAEASATLPRIGRAFVASGLTLAGGFAAMAVSPAPLLRDFGVVVAIDVVVALVSALVIMPPLLRWTDDKPEAMSPPPPVPETKVEEPPKAHRRTRQLVAHAVTHR